MNWQRQQKQPKAKELQCKIFISIAITLITIGVLGSFLIQTNIRRSEIEKSEQQLTTQNNSTRVLQTTNNTIQNFIIGQMICQCGSYLSQEDCQRNQCVWSNGCTQSPCKCFKDQQSCNDANGCSWTSFGTCIQIDCTQLTSISSGGCKNQKCGQSSYQNKDGSYNCTNFATSDLTLLTACEAQLLQTAQMCTSYKYCIWRFNSGSCFAATCSMQSTTNCDYVYKGLGSAQATQSACMIDTKSKSCMDAQISATTQATCNSISKNTYTWSSVSNSCTMCVVQKNQQTLTTQCSVQGDVPPKIQLRTCSCTQYMSEYDCTSNYCIWNQTCQDTPSSTSNKSYLLSQSDCGTRNSIDTCQASAVCFWNVNSQTCVNANCQQLSTQICRSVFDNSSDIILCVLDPIQNLCVSANQATLTPQNCNLLSKNTYTWSTQSSKCILCFATTQSILLPIIIKTIILML